MKLTSASVAVAGLALMPNAALANKANKADSNLQCSRLTLPGRIGAFTTTKTIHAVATATTTTTKYPTTTVTPVVTVTQQYPTHNHRPQTTTVTTTTSIKRVEATVPVPHTTTSTALSTTTLTKTAPATTVVAATPTTTIHTTAGFTPAASALTAAPKKRSAVPERAHARDVEIQKRANHVNEYCSTTVTDRTTTSTATVRDRTNTQTVTGPASTQTTWTTKTVTSTQAVVGTSTHTILRPFTTTATITNVATTHTTVTPIVTSTPAAVSLYAACGASNLLDYTLSRASNATTGTPYSKVAISGLAQITNEKRTVYTDIDTAYDCCAKCQATADCAGSSFATVSSSCVLYTASSCPAQGSNFAAFYTNGQSGSSSAAGEGYVVSNGLCGSWEFGGNGNES